VSDATPTGNERPGDAGTPVGADRPEPVEDGEVMRSRLVGLMARPVSSRVTVRRSTVLMAVAFLGFGTLMAIYPPAAKATTSNPNSDIVPGLVPATTTTTTTSTSTTTTTAPPPSSTTTTRPTTTTTRAGGGTSTTTTTTRASTTTTTKGGATTTLATGATTTTVTP
jgi:cytoskeletal protein RodZ